MNCHAVYRLMYSARKGHTSTCKVFIHAVLLLSFDLYLNITLRGLV